MLHQALAEFVSARRYETLCLALAVYHEARGEPEAGRQAVALVVLNRRRSPLYPSTLCGVVFQNAHKKNRCQFSFVCTGRPFAPSEPEAWIQALRTASAILAPLESAGGAPIDPQTAPVAAATHYHASRVNPPWARRLKQLGRIGRHVFFAAETSEE